MARKKRCDRNHAIYMITCLLTNERYIGVTVIRGRAFQGSVKTRWEGHVYHAMIEGRDYPLQRAIRQHGPSAFKHELLRVIRGKKEAHQIELDLIKSIGPELNVEGTNKKKDCTLSSCLQGV